MIVELCTGKKTNCKQFSVKELCVVQTMLKHIHTDRILNFDLQLQDIYEHTQKIKV